MKRKWSGHIEFHIQGSPPYTGGDHQHIGYYGGRGLNPDQRRRPCPQKHGLAGRVDLCRKHTPHTEQHKFDLRPNSARRSPQRFFQLGENSHSTAQDQEFQPISGPVERYMPRLCENPA